MAQNFSAESQQQSGVVEVVVNEQSRIWMPRATLEMLTSTTVPAWVSPEDPERIMAVVAQDAVTFAVKTPEPDSFKNGELAKKWSQEVSRGVKPKIEERQSPRRWFGLTRLALFSKL